MGMVPSVLRLLLQPGGETALGGKSRCGCVTLGTQERGKLVFVAGVKRPRPPGFRPRGEDQAESWQQRRLSGGHQGRGSGPGEGAEEDRQGGLEGMHESGHLSTVLRYQFPTGAVRSDCNLHSLGQYTFSPHSLAVRSPRTEFVVQLCFF